MRVHIEYPEDLMSKKMIYAFFEDKRMELYPLENIASASLQVHRNLQGSPFQITFCITNANGGRFVSVPFREYHDWFDNNKNKFYAVQ